MTTRICDRCGRVQRGPRPGGGGVKTCCVSNLAKRRLPGACQGYLRAAQFLDGRWIIRRSDAGRALRRFRLRAGMTQEQFAAEMGVAENTIARQERNEIGIGGPLLRLAKIIAERAKAAKAD